MIKNFLTETQQLVGRTIAGINNDYGECIILRFTDDTAAVFRLHEGDYDEGQDIRLWLYVDGVDQINCWREDGVEAGLYSREEMDSHDQKLIDAAAKRNREAERQQYERLKKKFEPPVSTGNP